MLTQIAGKQAGYRAMAEYYQSLVCKNNKSIGEEIARLEVIIYHLNYPRYRIQLFITFLQCVQYHVNNFSMLWNYSKLLSKGRISPICSKTTLTKHREI